MSKNRKKFIVFIVLSVFVHLLLFTVKIPTFYDKKSQPLIVERITLPQRDKKQIVDQSQPSKDTTPPKESKYLSKENQSIKEETKAMNVAKTQNSKPSVEVKGQSKTESTPTPPKKMLSMSDLGFNKPQPQQPSRKISSYSPPSTTDDYLPDVKPGFETTLNSQEFKYYSYFERIKDRLRMYWEPQLESKMQRVYQQGKEIGEEDLITKLTIVLNKKGELSKLVIIRNSGIEEVDAAAVKAFELAAPFPNPPTGMVEEDGNVHLTWSFVVQTKGLSNIFVFLSRR